MTDWDMWRPLGVRDDTDLATGYGELVDGVPSYLDDSLLIWATNRVSQN